MMIGYLPKEAEVMRRPYNDVEAVCLQILTVKHFLVV